MAKEIPLEGRLESLEGELAAIKEKAKSLEKRFVDELSAVLRTHHTERIDRFVEVNAEQLGRMSDAELKELKGEMEEVVTSTADTVEKNFADIWWKPDDEHLCSKYRDYIDHPPKVIPDELIKVRFEQFGQTIPLLAQHHELPIGGSPSDSTIQWEGTFANTFHEYLQVVNKGLSLADEIQKLRQKMVIESAKKRWRDA
jgi:hypothetical protein